MSALWTSEAMVAAMGGRPLGNLPREITGISIDTRTLAQGEAFFAIKGENFDGHDFATAAMAAGAGLMVVAEDRLASLGRLTMPMIVVEDVLHALELLGAAARARSRKSKNLLLSRKSWLTRKFVPQSTLRFRLMRSASASVASG